MILEILNKISDEKPTGKKQLLKEYEDNETLKRVFVATYDMRIRYYMTSPDVEAGTCYSTTRTLDECLTMLGALTSRRVTGHEAISYVLDLMRSLSERDAEVLKRVINKDLRCGMGTSTINSVYTDLIYIHPYKRCSTFSEKSIKKMAWPAISQTKEDGLYNDVVVDHDGNVTFMSRAGYEIPITCQELISHYSQAKGFVFNGEMLVMSNDGVNFLPREEGNGLINSDDIENVQSFIYLRHWDCIPYDDFFARKCELSYETRIEYLKRVTEKGFARSQMVDTRIVNNLREAMEHLREAFSVGLEGTVIKDRSIIWADHTCPKSIKNKLVFECDLEAVSINEGDGKYAGSTGSVLCKTSCGQLEVGVSGLTDAKRKELWDRRNTISGTIFTVKANDIMYNDEGLNSLFLPRMVEERQDKTVADDMNRVIEQRNAAMESMIAMCEGV